MLISLSGEWERFKNLLLARSWNEVFFSRKLITVLYLPSGKNLNEERKKQFTISNIKL